VSGGGEIKDPWTGRGWRGAKSPLMSGGGGEIKDPWTGRGWKGAEPPLVIRGGGSDPLDIKGLEGGGAFSGI
jgi:hypothetical protein